MQILNNILFRQDGMLQLVSKRVCREANSFGASAPMPKEGDPAGGIPYFAFSAS